MQEKIEKIAKNMKETLRFTCYLSKNIEQNLTKEMVTCNKHVTSFEGFIRMRKSENT